MTTINVDFRFYSGYIQTVLSFCVANALLSSSTGDTSNCIYRTQSNRLGSP